MKNPSANIRLGEKTSARHRRETIQHLLKQAANAVNASALAEQLGVSRQVIVGDIALLRAQGFDIVSTPRGYIVPSNLAGCDTVFKVACSHDMSLAKQEIYTIVDYGGTLVDVVVEHPLYGQLVGQLNIASRYDADDFFHRLETEHASLLSNLTDGIHLHTIACKNEATAVRIKRALQQLQVLLPDE